MVEERVGRSARSGALFVFFGRRRTAEKVVFADRTGICVFYKRLDAGTYRLPLAAEGATSVTIEEHALDELLDGIDLEHATRKPRPARVRVH